MQRDLPRAAVEFLQGIRAGAGRQRVGAPASRGRAPAPLRRRRPAWRRGGGLADDGAEAPHRAARVDNGPAGRRARRGCASRSPSRGFPRWRSIPCGRWAAPATAPAPSRRRGRRDRAPAGPSAPGSAGGARPPLRSRGPGRSAPSGRRGRGAVRPAAGPAATRPGPGPTKASDERTRTETTAATPRRLPRGRARPPREVVIR